MENRLQKPKEKLDKDLVQESEQSNTQESKQEDSKTEQSVKSASKEKTLINSVDQQTKITDQSVSAASLKTEQRDSSVSKKSHYVKNTDLSSKQSVEKSVSTVQPKMNTHSADHKHQRSNTHQQQNVNRRPNQPRVYSENDLVEMPTNELGFVAKRLGIIGSSLLSRDSLIKVILEYQEKPEVDIFVTGILEKLPDGFGFLRFSEYDYISGPDDVYVSPSFIRKHNLRTGDEIYGSIRKPKEGEKYFALQTIETVNARPLNELASRLNFDRLTPLHPYQRFNLETNPSYIATRIMNVFTPIGKGQRGLIVAPPKVGKTMLLKELALSILANHKEVHMIVLLIDERPEEVSDMKRTIKGSNVEIVSSTFDESAERHEQVAEIVLEKAKRLVEYGKDVVILLDSITRLARAYNTIAPTSGKVLTGGIDAHALQRPKRFFGAARKTEEAGSLTIMATAMVETGSRMDEVIYEEFKGTGNMELHLTRKLSNRRTFPAFDILSSSTRRDDLLLSEDELNQAWILHRLLSTMNVVEGMEFIINKMKQYKTNDELFESLKKSGGAASSGNSNGNGHHSNNE